MALARSETSESGEWRVSNSQSRLVRAGVEFAKGSGLKVGDGFAKEGGGRGRGWAAVWLLVIEGRTGWWAGRSKLLRRLGVGGFVERLGAVVEECFGV